MNDCIDVGSNQGTVQTLRRFLSLIALGALVTSLSIYAMSFFGITMEQLGILPFVLHVGIFALMVPMGIIEYPASQERSFYWKGFSVGKPDWVPRVISGLGIFFIVQFALFLFMSHGAAPRIVAGTSVLDDHGHIVKVLTESQYRRLKGYELRPFAALWIFAYSISVLYWWFPRLKREALHL